MGPLKYEIGVLTSVPWCLVPRCYRFLKHTNVTLQKIQESITKGKAMQIINSVEQSP